MLCLVSVEEAAGLCAAAGACGGLHQRRRHLKCTTCCQVIAAWRHILRRVVQLGTLRQHSTPQCTRQCADDSCSSLLCLLVRQQQHGQVLPCTVCSRCVITYHSWFSEMTLDRLLTESLVAAWRYHNSQALQQQLLPCGVSHCQVLQIIAWICSDSTHIGCRASIGIDVSSSSSLGSC